MYQLWKGSESLRRTQFTILNESGIDEALYGLGLSHGVTSDISFKEFMSTQYTSRYLQMKDVAVKLANKDGGHNKFLESIAIWMKVNAPRYWWQEFDTYRIGITKQSESTMHTVLTRELTQLDFVDHISEQVLEVVNSIIRNKAWKRTEKIKRLKAILPEGFLQTRVICTNYKALRNILLQRKSHDLDEWQEFYRFVVENCKWPELLPKV
jgi:hypothetical protein